jgi:hypothetical protein
MARNLLSKPAFHILLVIILGVLGYSNTLNVPFQFDDVSNIVENPVVKNLNYYVFPAKAKTYRGSTEYPMLINRYIGSLTFALNYKIHGLEVTGYHIVNLIIHLINSLLVYWFVHLIFLTLTSGAGGDNPLFLKHASTIALFSSLLFVTHPIQTQAVTYIIQRFASLASMFYLFATIMYIKTRLTINDVNNNSQGKKLRVRGLTYYMIALIAAVLAMKAKEIAFTLPVMIVLCELIFFKGDTKKRILYLGPFILTMLIIPVTLIFIVDLVGGSGTATRLQTNMTRLDYLFTEFRVIITYIRLVFFPVAQNLDYDYPLYHSIFEPEVFLSFMALLMICFTVTYSFWRYRITLPLTRVIFFGTAWFFTTLSIESSLIPIIDVIFEHRMYLPSVGLFLTISTLLVMIVERYQPKWIERTVFLSVILASLPDKARGYNYLGLAHYENENLDSAIKFYKKAAALNPSYANAYSNLGIAYFEKGLIDESIKAFRNAILVDPSHADAHFNLGLAYGEKGLMKQAIIEMRKGTMLKK